MPKKYISNRSELCAAAAAAAVLVWYQSCTAKQHKILHLCRQVCQRERQTAGSRGPRATLWALMSAYPFMLPFTLYSSLSLLLSHSALFPFDHIRAKTCSAIYRRVVLFYLPVSICGTQKYRGLPGCWRQQCSAAEGWVECAREEGKERQTERDQMTKGRDKRRVG